VEPITEFVPDSPLEGNGFENSVPGCLAIAIAGAPLFGGEWWLIDRRRGGIVRAVVGLGEPIELLRRLASKPLLIAPENG
jgi:hypothetical protein